MDSVALATLTSAVTILGYEVVKGVADSAGKDLWTKIRSLFGWKADPSIQELPEKTATALLTTPGLATQLKAILDQAGSVHVSAETINGAQIAQKIVNAGVINTDTFQM